MDLEKTYTGTAIFGDPPQPRPVTIVVNKGVITRIEDEKSVPEQWICPGFFNAHTHLADTVAMDLPCSGNLVDLVTPPNGLKHQILAKTSSEILVQGMRASIKQMIAGGTCGFADFREGGPEGVALLKKSCADLPCHPVILGRQGGEKISDGAGISSSRDIQGFEKTAELMKKNGKIVAFHAGEQDEHDIDAALACDPDVLVHCTHAAPRHIRAIADAGISVVICPRSNFLLGVTGSSQHPPVKEMISAGVKLLIGTDNAMFVQPDIMQEISFCHTVYGIPPVEVFKSATSGFPPATINHAIEVGNKANFFILDISNSNLGFSHDPVSSLVKRAPSRQICATIFYV